jgi:hypothetical protein
VRYLRGVRRRDLAVSGQKRGSRRTFVLVAVVAGIVVLTLLWLALQTLGEESSKESAVAASLCNF